MATATTQCSDCEKWRSVLDSVLCGNVLQEEQLEAWYVASKFALHDMPATIARNRLAKLVRQWEDANR